MKIFFGSSLWTSMQNMRSLAWKMAELYLILAWFGLVLYGIIFGYCLNYYHAKSQVLSLKNEWLMVNLVKFDLDWISIVLYGMAFGYCLDLQKCNISSS